MKTEPLTPIKKAQLSGEICEMILKTTDDLGESLQILDGVLSLLTDRKYLIARRDEAI